MRVYGQRYQGKTELVRKRKKWYRQSAIALFLLYAFFLMVKAGTGRETLAKRFFSYVQNEISMSMTRQYIPTVAYMAEGRQEQTLSDFLLEKVTDQIPLIGYADTIRTYETTIESSLSEEEIVALEGKDEAEVEARQMAEAASRENQDCIVAEMEQENAQAGADAAAEAAEQPAAPDNTAVSSQPLVEIPREKLNDFDYLIQNFYQVDNTTTINSSQLNAEELLNMDLTIKTPADQPQILIYHTHSQEMFADSDPNDVMTGVMGTGEYLTSLLQEKYGFQVMHHMGQYDVGDRDHAYANAEGPIEQLLAENPSIEVVIDLHRDAVDKHMVREVNGVQMAPIMFFNGLSRTKALGDISYLNNPNLTGNLAFSLQMQIAAAEYYPNLTRPIYLKGYRYNMHFKEKYLLIEMGSYTNTQEEARNAMVPLADLLNRVLHGEN